jgi:muramoyltetrapeptide carboxypeptidase
MKVAIVAPACPLPPEVPGQMNTLVQAEFGAQGPELLFHPQCFLSHGHFAGDDAARRSAVVEVANDPGVDAVWFARGGYGSNRIAAQAVAEMGAAARDKLFLGYSDMGFMFGAMMRAGIGRPVHAPMVADIRRVGGETAVLRSLRWLVRGDAGGLEPAATSGLTVAFNITVLSHMAGTALMPDLSGKVLMLEDVDEHHYQLDRALFQIFASKAVEGVAGVRLGRCAAKENDRPFGQDELAICQHWCDVATVPFLGRADIGHDVDNKIVPFG